MAFSMAVLCSGECKHLAVDLTVRIQFSESIGVQDVEVLADGDGALIWVVNKRWLEVSSDFRQQLLNPYFVKIVLERRPALVYFDQVCGASLDLINLSKIFEIRTLVGSGQFREADLNHADRRAVSWVSKVLAGVERVDEIGAEGLLPISHHNSGFVQGSSSDVSSISFADRYAAYALGYRNHGLLFEMQAPHASFFNGCSRILDLGCGTGVFLDVLDRVGLHAEGVERNRLSVEYAKGLGHRIHCADAVEFISEASNCFDGIYCSHFVEHLPVDVLDRLVQAISNALVSGGVVVFVFPDPESIRSQLLGFWRDPEHVRFYHPDLIALMCSMARLELVENSQVRPGRRVFPFSMSAPEFSSGPLFSDPPSFRCKAKWHERVLSRLGLASQRQMIHAVEEFERAFRCISDGVNQRLSSLEDATQKLWNVNQTWAWDDNAVMVFKKR